MSHKLFRMPLEAEHIINRLIKEGYDAYVVGGCVRDMMYGALPNDWDICTSARPEQVIKIFKDYKVIKTGLKHGTVTLVTRGGDQYEVTTFRIDGDYSDGRHPDKVDFTSDVKEDLARRDFTINAMAYNHFEGLIDPFGGYTDVTELETIRCVGDPDERFNEDGLRILRALRFSSVYGFTIEPETDKSIHANRDLLKKISAERIQVELIKLLHGRNVLEVLLKYSDVICTIIPEMQPCVGFDQNNKYHVYTVYEHIAHAVANYRGTSAAINMALLLHDIGKPSCYTEDENGGHFHGHAVPSRDIAEQVLNRLKFDNATKEAVLDLVLYHDVTVEPTFKSVRRMLSKLGYKRMCQWGLVRVADIAAHTPGTQDSRLKKVEAIGKVMDQIMAEDQCFKIKDLEVNGDDIMQLGVKQGPEVGKILKYLLDKVIDEELPNERRCLIEEARKLTSNKVTT